MATNFAFLKDEWPEVHTAAVKAEKLANTDPRTTCFHARYALELIVNWIFEYDEELTPPWENTLNAKIQSDDFRNNTPPGVFTKINFVRKLGNNAVHSGKPVSIPEAVQSFCVPSVL